MMTLRTADRRLLISLLPVLGVGVLVLVAGAAVGGLSVATVAAVGLATTLLVFALAESAAWLSGTENPVFRMLLTMGVRAGLAAAAIVLAVKSSGVEPRTIVMVALPLYLSLIAGEVMLAKAAQPTTPGLKASPQRAQARS